jgi:cation diffusion facilitator CzcD-associated flavoprotein CzcO
MDQAPPEVANNVVVIGAGMGGLRMVYELRKQGFEVQGIEAGSDVGGTWYWNTYPGARTDTEAWGYGFFFDKELATDWGWDDRYPNQAQMHKYLEQVATRFDLRKSFEFGQFVQSARFDTDTGKWTVETDKGCTFTATYLVTACGVLSSPVMPDIKGLDQFEGTAIHSARWPKEGIDLAGKRVAIIGSGATGVQLLPVLSQVAGHVSMFQRTPNYVIPARNNPLLDQDRERLRHRYDVMKDQIRNHPFASTFDLNERESKSLSYEERQRVLEAKWEFGGFQYVWETFNDFFSSDQCNEELSEFIRKKIRIIVDDPVTAEALCPKYPLFSKRPPLGHGYFEAFNRDNVSLVDISAAGIEEITRDGIRTNGVEHPFDVIIFATGFDAGTGALTDMNVVGSDGISLRDKWADGPLTYFGICVDGFPNMFMISGPQTPLSVVPPAIEAECEWIAKVLKRARSTGTDRVEVSASATRDWKEAVDASARGTLLEKAHEVRSWWLGANVKGKAHVMQFYVGGFKEYADQLDRSVAADYPDLTFTKTASQDLSCQDEWVGG